MREIEVLPSVFISAVEMEVDLDRFLRHYAKYAEGYLNIDPLAKVSIAIPEEIKDEKLRRFNPRYNGLSKKLIELNGEIEDRYWEFMEKNAIDPSTEWVNVGNESYQSASIFSDIKALTIAKKLGTYLGINKFKLPEYRAILDFWGQKLIKKEKVGKAMLYDYGDNKLVALK